MFRFYSDVSDHDCDTAADSQPQRIVFFTTSAVEGSTDGFIF